MFMFAMVLHVHVFVTLGPSLSHYSMVYMRLPDYSMVNYSMVYGVIMYSLFKPSLLERMHETTIGWVSRVNA